MSPINGSSWGAVPAEPLVIHQLQLRFAYSSTVSTDVSASEFLFFKTCLSVSAYLKSPNLRAMVCSSVLTCLMDPTDFDFHSV